MSSDKSSKAVNAPDSRHIDDRKVLTDLHNKAPGKPCFWKHGYGESNDECIAIPSARYDTHPCHYRANGIKRAESEPHVYNTRPHPVLGGRARKDNREVAMLLGYIVLDITRRKETHSRTTPEFTHLAEDIAAHKERSGAGKGMRFLDAYRGRYGKSLGWLAQDPHAWDVKHRMILHPKDFRRVFGATKDNEVKNYESDFTGVSSEIREDVWQRVAPVNFHIKETNVPGGQGLGKWYPYEHDHHHMIPASAFQEYVLNGPSSNPSEINYMSRARVVMQGSWNIHNQVNMILLPNEVYPARILDLAAHIPWQMGADHKPYSKSLEKKLEPIRKILDDALRNPSEQPHDAEENAATDFSREMTDLCNEQREEFLEKGFFVLEPK
ncbi:AHH domain-containing protein [Archangium violaceum]|uniref:AHH domain-containing protein n=1 Tax=Archangium violaceum TaxID=83451 RepID=UPI00193AF53E|nr:AHH domain-containing protein [Archangium violaceum]QRK06482.1 AHH domain-containing protein [Archangium violaceum]